MKIDRSDWGRLRVIGGDRERFLQGLTTVNVAALAEGTHGWGAILNPKGRVLSVIAIARFPDAFAVLCEPALVDKTRALLERYAVMDDVVFEAATGPVHQVIEAPEDLWRAPLVHGAGDVQSGDPAAERMRIRAGFLRYDADVDEDHFPFETPLVQFLDYSKGCYVGQEPVFRVHAQGNAARALRGLVVDGAVAPGAVIKHPAKDHAGVVTSAVAGDDGKTWALGYLHRTTWEVGGRVEIEGKSAEVRALPW